MNKWKYMKKTCIVFLAFAGLLAVSSCGNRKTTEAETSVVRLFTVKNADAASVQEFPGRVKAAEEVNMAFKVSGTLMNVHVEEGGKVRKGQLVAEIDPRDYQVQLDAAEAEFMRVKSEAGRVMALYADSVSTADAYDKARYGLQQITVKYEHAKNQLADTKIYAPFDGFVQKRLFDPPTVVAAGMPVVTLVSGGRQEIEINIPASAYIHRDRMVSFHAAFDFLPGRDIPLHLISIAPKANANQLYTMRLSLPSDVSPQPSPGMNTMVKIESSDAAGKRVQIPSSALFKKEGKSCVWIYDEQSGTVRMRTVSVERLHTDGTAIVTDGLAAEEQVVATGVHNLTDGQKVQPMEEQSETNVGGLL